MSAAPGPRIGRWEWVPTRCVAVAGSRRGRGNRGGGAADPSRGRTRRPGRDSVWLILAVAGVIAVGIVLRFVARSDLWADEALSVNIAGLPLSDLQEALRHDGAPPLYYALLHAWMAIFGTGNEAARSLSGVFAVIALRTGLVRGAPARRAPDRGRAPGCRVRTRSRGRRCCCSRRRRSRSGTRPKRGCTRSSSCLCSSATSPSCAVFDRPSWGRLLGLAVVTALLLYTHYWAFALLASSACGSLCVAVRGAPEQRRPAAFAIGALGVGALTFIPWLPTFLDQAAHTGTPWGGVVSPLSSTAEAVKSFGGNTHAVGWALLLVVLLALFARAVDQRHLDIDLWTRPGVRIELGIAFVTLGLGLVMARRDRDHVRGPVRVGDVPAVPVGRGLRDDGIREPWAGATRSSRCCSSAGCGAVRATRSGAAPRRSRSRTRSSTTPGRVTSSSTARTRSAPTSAGSCPATSARSACPASPRRVASTGSTTRTASTRCALWC